MYWKHFKEDKNAPSLGMLHKTLYQCKYYQFHIGIVDSAEWNIFQQGRGIFLFVPSPAFLGGCPSHPIFL